MKFKKLLILPLVASIGLGATAIFANNEIKNKSDLDDISTEFQPIRRVGLMSTVNGKVTGINEYTNDEGTSYYLEILSDESVNYIVAIEGNTAIIKDGELVDIESIEEGMELTVKFRGEGISAGPLVLDLNEEDLKALEQGENLDINTLDDGIVRVIASAIVISTEEHPLNVYVDIFDEDLVSSDYNLILSIHEDTVIVDINNEVYEGSLENKKLAVIYSASTRSLPAIPIQPKIIVLDELEFETLEFGTLNTNVEMDNLVDSYSSSDIEIPADPVIVVENSQL